MDARGILVMELFDRRNAPKRADTWFVYALVDSRTPDDIRYIGITNHPKSRLSLHQSQASKEGWRKSRWIQSALAGGGDILMGVIDRGLSHDEAKAKEIALIANHRNIGTNITNLTDGGDGVSGAIQSVETRTKRSAALKGRLRSQEHCENIAKAHRGKKLSAIARENMSAAHIKRYADNPEQRERQSAGTIARFEDPKERERFSELTKQRFARDGERERHSAIMRQVANDNPDIATRRRKSKISNGPQSNSLTGFKGVFFDKSKRKFCSRIKVAGKSKHIGYFSTAEDAARAYDNVARSHYGDSTYTNFPLPLQAS
jgi:hypothetical protein